MPPIKSISNLHIKPQRIAGRKPCDPKKYLPGHLIELIASITRTSDTDAGNKTFTKRNSNPNDDRHDCTVDTFNLKTGQFTHIVLLL